MSLFPQNHIKIASGGKFMSVFPEKSLKIYYYVYIQQYININQLNTYSIHITQHSLTLCKAKFIRNSLNFLFRDRKVLLYITLSLTHLLSLLVIFQDSYPKQLAKCSIFWRPNSLKWPKYDFFVSIRLDPLKIFDKFPQTLLTNIFQGIEF